jgi:hypothetical protein
MVSFLTLQNSFFRFYFEFLFKTSKAKETSSVAFLIIQLQHQKSFSHWRKIKITNHFA